MKMFGYPKEIFLVQKQKLILKYMISGQGDKITPEAKKKEKALL